jgi:hypothetical protein
VGCGLWAVTYHAHVRTLPACGVNAVIDLLAKAEKYVVFNEKIIALSLKQNM